MTGSTPTLRDVARLAGVSLGTASYALNNKANVSPETRAKVLEAANALGYQIQVRSSASIRQNLRVIGMIGKMEGDKPLAINPFYSYVLAGIERECQRQNLSLMYTNIQVDRLNRPTSLPPMLLDDQVDGILMVGTFLQDTIQVISEKVNKPVVLVDAYAPGCGFDSVVTDNIHSAVSAVEYLLEQGHTRIGLVGSTPNGYPSIRERRKGYFRALKRHGITQTYVEDTPLSREGGYNGTCALLQRAPEVTAIFACNDEVAVGVLNAAREIGRSVPDELSVIGFDDIDLAQEVTPPLTTVHVDKVLFGVLAVRLLIDRAENLDRPALTTAISAPLIVRGSVKAHQAK